MSTRKYVMYNGGKESYKACSSPEVLIKDRIYAVESYTDHGFQTNIELFGVDGEFNSVWFKEVTTYKAVSYEKPVIGERYECYVFERDINEGKPFGVRTNCVSDIIHLERDKYAVISKSNHVYETVVF